MSRPLTRQETSRTKLGSVIPAMEQMVTLVRLRRPTTCSSSRSSGVLRCRRRRLVLVRTVSVNASFAPLMVFSTSGDEMERFSPVFTSNAAA